MKGGDKQVLIQKALNEIRADEQLQEMEMTLAFFASFVMQTKLIQKIMRWDMALLRQSPWYNQILAEGRELGLEEARQNAIEMERKAIEMERQASERHLLQVLSHRFGEMPEDVLANLRTLGTSSLESLLNVALSAASLDQFRQHPLLTGS